MRNWNTGEAPDPLTFTLSISIVPSPVWMWAWMWDVGVDWMGWMGARVGTSVCAGVGGPAGQPYKRCS